MHVLLVLILMDLLVLQLVGQFLHKKSGSQEDNHGSFADVLTHVLVVEDTRTFECCYSESVF